MRAAEASFREAVRMEHCALIVRGLGRAEVSPPGEHGADNLGKRDLTAPCLARAATETCSGACR